MLQKLSWSFGIIILVLGVLGFVKAASPGGLLLGAFAVDTMGSVIYIATGALAIVAARQSGPRTRLYFKVFGIVYALITVLGFLQGNTVLGLMEVNTAGNVLNLLIALVALWAGFGSKEEAPAQAQTIM
jgi:hypothetical protein